MLLGVVRLIIAFFLISVLFFVIVFLVNILNDQRARTHVSEEEIAKARDKIEELAVESLKRDMNL